MTSYLSAIAAMRLTRTVSEIQDDISRKSQNFTLDFNTPDEGFPFEFGIRAWCKKTSWMRYQREQKV